MITKNPIFKSKIKKLELSKIKEFHFLTDFCDFEEKKLETREILSHSLNVKKLTFSLRFNAIFR